MRRTTRIEQRVSVTLCTNKLAPEKTCPHFNAFKYDSEEENSVYWVKNIERMGKTTYEFKITLLIMNKKGILPNFRQGGRGKFHRG